MNENQAHSCCNEWLITVNGRWNDFVMIKSYTKHESRETKKKGVSSSSFDWTTVEEINNGIATDEVFFSMFDAVDKCSTICWYSEYDKCKRQHVIEICITTLSAEYFGLPYHDESIVDSIFMSFHSENQGLIYIECSHLKFVEKVIMLDFDYGFIGKHHSEDSKLYNVWIEWKRYVFATDKLWIIFHFARSNNGFANMKSD